MARKRALVVDDSRSARVILSRMLEKYDIETDTAESAEQAIEYLEHHRPDAIFMDHLMPGMDGLQAVHAIKSNPRTAMIPIMMYTSQEGELYVGQARALGAMGVLPKQVRPVDVSKVLYELHLLPERRDPAEPAMVPVELVGGTAIERPAVTRAADAMTSGIDWGRRVEGTVKEQVGDLRRFIVASLESFATRIVTDVRESVPAPAAEPAPSPGLARRPVWPWVTALAALVAVAVGCAVFGQWAFEESRRSRADLAAMTSANAELRRSREELAATVKGLTAALAASTAAPSPAASGSAASTRVEQVPYGEIPFDRSRVEALRDFLTRLEAQGFRGVVRITSTAGIFCLSGNSTDGFVPASAALPANKCDLVGNPFDESLRAQQRQSLAFANLVSGVQQRSAGAISIVIDNGGGARPATPYPQHNDALTAGEWNRAAAANNHVEFAADPST
ncbi:MAG: response regulator [Pseudomonadota bacterium]|nr:response regulator [Pseudomonadota bacterium]